MTAGTRVVSALLQRRGGGPGAARPAGRHAKAVAVLVLVIVGVVFPQVYGGSTYYMSVGTECLIYALVTVTLNLLVGYGGQISLGHAGLLAVGAYTAGILLAHVPWLPYPIEVIAAGAVAMLVGFILGLPTGRLRGPYLAVVTLGFGVAIPQIALNLGSFTQGWTGITVAPAHIGGLQFADPVGRYYLTLVVVGLSLIGILSILGTSTGRSFTAVRDSEEAAAAMGVHVQRTKVLLFATSAFFTGVAGDLFAQLQGIVAPTSFPFSLSLFFLAAVVVGGLASVWGGIAGGIFLTLVDAATSNVSALEPVIIGGVVVVVIIALPGGLASLPRALAQLASRVPARRPGASAPERAPTRGGTV